jgi:hypothetical protein
MTDPADIPPHLAADEGPVKAAPTRPIEAAAVHLRMHGRCYAAMVIDVIAEDPLDPDFRVDLVAFQPRDRSRKDRFTNPDTMVGHVRWANNLAYALPDNREAIQVWPERTWHFPSRYCLPEIVLSQAEEQHRG